MTWYPEAFTKIPMNDMNMRADPSRGYPGRTYRFYIGNQVYGFGHGLSYTNFSYKLLSAPKQLSLSRSINTRPIQNILNQRGNKVDFVPLSQVASCDSLKFDVQISVMNEGEMDGSNVVMLFSRLPKIFEGVTEKQLIGFSRVATTSFNFTDTSIVVDPCNHLSIASERGERVLPLGNHVLVLGDLEHIVSIEI